MKSSLFPHQKSSPNVGDISTLSRKLWSCRDKASRFKVLQPGEIVEQDTPFRWACQSIKRRVKARHCTTWSRGYRLIALAAMKWPVRWDVGQRESFSNAARQLRNIFFILAFADISSKCARAITRARGQ